MEVHKPGVGALLSGLVSQKLTNVRVYSCDALEVLRDCVADASLDRVLLFFPDPGTRAVTTSAASCSRPSPSWCGAS